MLLFWTITKNQTGKNNLTKWYDSYNRTSINANDPRGKGKFFCMITTKIFVVLAPSASDGIDKLLL